MSIANTGLDEINQFIETVHWKFASTMPKVPHEYTMREWNDAAPFEAFLHYILHFGDLRKEYHWKRIYLDVGDYYYWWMGAPIHRATVINRARLDQPERSNFIS